MRESLQHAPGSLLAGGTAARSRQPDAALRQRHEVVEIAGMNHGMFVGSGWRESSAAVTTILTAIDSFLGRIADGP